MNRIENAKLLISPGCGLGNANFKVYHDDDGYFIHYTDYDQNTHERTNEVVPVSNKVFEDLEKETASYQWGDGRIAECIYDKYLEMTSQHEA